MIHTGRKSKEINMIKAACLYATGTHQSSPRGLPPKLPSWWPSRGLREQYPAWLLSWLLPISILAEKGKLSFPKCLKSFILSSYINPICALIDKIHLLLVSPFIQVRELFFDRSSSTFHKRLHSFTFLTEDGACRRR